MPKTNKQTLTIEIPETINSKFLELGLPDAPSAIKISKGTKTIFLNKKEEVQIKKVINESKKK